MVNKLSLSSPIQFVRLLLRIKRKKLDVQCIKLLSANNVVTPTELEPVTIDYLPATAFAVGGCSLVSRPSQKGLGSGLPSQFSSGRVPRLCHLFTVGFPQQAPIESQQLYH